MENMLLDINQVAEILAVHARTVDRWYRSGRMPQPVRPGGSALRWRLSDIHSWIDADCRTVEFGGWEES